MGLVISLCIAVFLLGGTIGYAIGNTRGISKAYPEGYQEGFRAGKELMKGMPSEKIHRGPMADDPMGSTVLGTRL